MNDVVPLNISLGARFQHIITYFWSTKADLIFISIRLEDFKNTRMNTNNHLQAEYVKFNIHNHDK